MPRPLAPVVLAWILATVAGKSLAAGPAIPEDVKARARQQVDNGYTPGIVICLLSPDGRDSFSYGRISYDVPGSPDETTLFEIASVTKTFTAVLLAQMVEAGDVGLDDPVAGFLPAGVQLPANGGAAITLKQLATHTSGLPNTPGNLLPTITDFANQFENYTTDLLYEFLGSYSMTAAPGTRYEYSNLGMALLGHALALSQDTDYETLLRQRVLEPMGLFDTAIGLSASQRTRTAPGHHGVVQRPPLEMNSFSPAGGLKSCAYDLGTYLAYNLGISSGPISSALALTHQLHYDLPDASYDYDLGLGWWLQPDGIVQHGGDSFGSTAFIGFKESTGTGVVVLSNNRAHYPAGIADLGRHCLDPTDLLQPVPDAVTVPLATLRNLVGDYGAVRFDLIHDRPVMEVVGQLAYTAYANPTGGFKVLDLGLEIDLAFQLAAGTGEATHLNLRQNGGPPISLARIRHDGHLGIRLPAGSDRIRLELTGEGDRDYPLECSGDLRHWQPAGSLSIWDTPREEPAGAGQKYFRIREP